jgi:hypothetical protein
VESGALLWSLVHVTPSTAISLYRDVTVVDGEPVVVGLVSDQVADDNGLMLRYDAQGGLVWSQTLDGEGQNDRLDGVAFDGQQLVATGRSVVDDPTVGVQGFTWLVVAQPGGGVPVQLTLSQGRGLSIVPSPGGVLIAGVLDPDGVPWAGEFMADGTENFSATDGTTDVGQFAAVVIDSQGGMFAAGFRETADGKDFILDEITDTGLLSLGTLSGPFGSAEGQALAATDAGDLWAGGYVQAGADNAHRNWLTRRYRATGEIVSEDEWTQPGSMLSDEVQAITIDAVGDVIAAGFTNVGGNTMMMVRRYSPTGSIRWTQTYDYGPDKDVIRGITPDDEGGLYVVGEVTEDNGQQVGWLGRLGP